MKDLICCWREMKGWGITKVARIHLQSRRNICRRFHGNPSLCCRDKFGNQHAGYRKCRVTTEVRGIHCLGTMNVRRKFHIWWQYITKLFRCFRTIDVAFNRGMAKAVLTGANSDPNPKANCCPHLQMYCQSHINDGIGSQSCCRCLICLIRSVLNRCGPNLWRR